MVRHLICVYVGSMTTSYAWVKAVSEIHFICSAFHVIHRLSFPCSTARGGKLSYQILLQTTGKKTQTSQISMKKERPGKKETRHRQEGI